MPDVVDTVPPALDVEGNTVIWWVPTIADKAAPKAATEIGAATSFRLTHSFTTTGFALTGSQAKNPDERLALLDVLESLGKVTRSLSLEYVDTTAAGSAAVVLQEGLLGNFVVRRNVSNKTLAAATQKSTVIPVTLGVQVEGELSGKFRISQEVAITGPIVKAVFAA